MSEIDYWNNDATAEYFAAKPADPRIVKFVESYDLSRGNRALDLGCGGGRHSELLAQNGFVVSSVDVNSKMLATTRYRLMRQGLPLDVRYGSILDIPYDNDTFNVVVATGVLHQAESTEDFDAAVADLSRVIKIGGFALLNIFTDAVSDETYHAVSGDGRTVRTREGLLMTLLPRTDFVSMMQRHDLALEVDQGEDIKQENTGPRAIYRGFFRKTQGLS